VVNLTKNTLKFQIPNPKSRTRWDLVIGVWVLLSAATSVYAQGQRAVEQGPAPEVPRTLRAAAPIDLTGTWVSVVTEDWRWRMMTPPRYDYAAVPMNADARRVADNWDPAADEAAGQQCKVYGAAAVMRVPGRLRVSWADDNTLKVETDAGAQTRMLRYGTSETGTARTWQGQTKAIWQMPEATGRGGRGGPRSGQLKTVTTNLRAGYLRTNGVPYSENAVVTEYYVRVTAPNGDEWLVVTSMVDDPTYLNEPFVTSSHFKKEPNDAKFAPVPCGATSTSSPAVAQNDPGLPFETITVEVAGYWNDLFHEDLWDRRSGLLVGDYTGLPLNEAGKLASASWEPGWFAIPEEQCRPHTGIYGPRGPSNIHVARVVNPETQAVMRYDVFLGISERTIFVDGRPHPPEYAPHLFAGFSTGQWEGLALKFTTTHNKAGYLQRNGTPHSDQAVATEWFIRQGDTLLLISLIDDPGYMSEGLMRTTNWKLDRTPQRAARAGTDCNPFEVADERIGQEKHFVPHYLPGQYEVHKEFQTMFGIPQEAAFGGAETLYPEYKARLDQLRAAMLKRTTSARPVAGSTTARADFVGEWRLNRGKSNFEVSWRREGLDGRDGSAPERRIIRITAAANGALAHQIDTQIVANDTGFFRLEYTAPPDGKDYPAKGGAVETFSLKRVDPLTIERTGKIKGAVVETGVWKLSPDGKVLTITTQGDVNGAKYSNVQVFEREN
jgi:hypothetical protein